MDKHKDYKIFEIFEKQWALATAGTIDSYNTCTIGWGSLGTIWGKQTVTIYVNPKRYTWEFLKDSELFTVSFFPEECRQALNYLGTHSGRDGDKVAKAGLTPKEISNTVTFEEASHTFVCRKLYQGPFEREGLTDDMNKFYTGWEPHWMFVGEVIEEQ